MVVSPQLNAFHLVTITFKNLEDQSTLSFNFTDREITSSSKNYYPLLESISECGLEVGQDGMPVRNDGAIEIRDPFNSYKHEVRFFDLLDGYTCINQPIEIFYANDTVGTVSPTFRSVWKGKVADVSKDMNSDDQKLKFTVTSILIDDGFLNFTMADPPVTTVPIELDPSYGSVTVPIVFGEGVDYAIPKTQTVSGSPLNVLYSNFYNYTDGLSLAIQSGNFNMYTQDADGYYRPVTLAAFPASNTTGSNYPTPDGSGLEQAWRIPDSILLAAGPAVGIKVRFKGQNSGGITPTGTITISIYKLKGNSNALVPGDVVCSATFDKADFLTEVRGASDFYISLAFDSMFITDLEGDLTGTVIGNGYAIGFQNSNYGSSVTDFVYGGVTATTSTEKWTKKSDGEWGTKTTVSELPLYQFLEVSDTSVSLLDSLTGRVIEGILLSDGNTYSANQNQPDIELDLFVRADGMVDGSNADITGVFGTRIKYPHHVIKFLTAQYASSEWTISTNWDWSKFSSIYSTCFVSGGINERYITGAVTEQTSITDLIATIVKETACFIVPLSTGKLALYPWGTTRPVVKVFTDDDVTWNSWQMKDLSSVVNRAKIYYGKNFLGFDTATAVVSGLDGYSGVADLNAQNATIDTALSSKSRTLYGIREYEAYQTQFLGDAVSAKTLSVYLCSVFNNPWILAEFSVPFRENDTLELMDVIEVVSAKMPCSGGTTLYGREPTYNGEECNLFQGAPITRGRRYRMQIIGRSISWDFQSGDKLSLTCRVLSPYHPNDPT